VLARDETGGTPRGCSLFLVELAAPGVIREVVRTIDIIHGHARLILEDVAAEPLGPAGEAWPIIEQVFDRAAVLIAFEQVGGAERTLEMARDFALDRMAFGRPIGSFQALKHMMANMYVAATLARSNAYYGAWALSTEDEELPVAAATALLSASQAFLECAKNNIQVHGGMGFTWESDCHLFYRRANALSVALGPRFMWQDRLIERMRQRSHDVTATEKRP
jgi:acyl-CoA dehydrogenase